MRKIIALLFMGFLIFDIKAQPRSVEYRSDDRTHELHSGDTICFLNGSLGGQFVHVFYMVGNIQKRKATFSAGFYTELIIDHFQVRKEKGVSRTYAVMNIANKPGWSVWAMLDDALVHKEIKIKSS